MYIRNNIKELLPYSTARDDYKGGDISVWLDANESPYNNGVNRYPDPHQKALKGEIAAPVSRSRVARIRVTNAPGPMSEKVSPL